MTQAASDVLTAFGALAPTEQQLVAAEILRRSATDELSATTFDELADEVFRGYDAEEAGTTAT